MASAPVRRRLLVALDAARETDRALTQAARLAQTFEVDLCGLWLEDPALQAVAAHGGWAITGTIAPGPQTRGALGRAMKSKSQGAQRSLQAVARTFRIETSFESCRGQGWAVTQSRAQDTDFILLGPPVAGPRISVVYDAEPGALAAVMAAVKLTRAVEGVLTVLLPTTRVAQGARWASAVRTALDGAGVAATLVTVLEKDATALGAQARRHGTDLLIMDRDSALLAPGLDRPAVTMLLVGADVRTGSAIPSANGSNPQ